MSENPSAPLLDYKTKSMPVGLPGGVNVVNRLSGFDETRLEPVIMNMNSVIMCLTEAVSAGLLAFITSSAVENYKSEISLVAAAYALTAYFLLQAFGDEKILLKPGLISASYVNSIIQNWNGPNTQNKERFKFWFFRMISNMFGGAVGVWVTSDYKGDMDEVGDTDAIEASSDFRMLAFTFIFSFLYTWIWTRINNRSNHPDYLYQSWITDPKSGNPQFFIQDLYAEHYASTDRSNLPKIIGALVFVAVISAGRIMPGFEPLMSQNQIVRALMVNNGRGLWQIIVGDQLGSLIGLIPHFFLQRRHIKTISNATTQAPVNGYGKWRAY